MSVQFQNRLHGDLVTNKISPTIKTGFKSPVYDAQSVFRKVLKSMSEPGIIAVIEHELEVPEPLNVASYAIVLALVDHDTSIALIGSLNEEDVLSTLRFHCSSSIKSDSETADFILCDETEIPDLETLKLGSESYPDNSCTVIIQSKDITQKCKKGGECILLTGAGIQDKHYIYCSAITDKLMKQRETLQKLFPLGVDLIFTQQESFFCLPRTTLIQNLSENKSLSKKPQLGRA